MKRILLLTGISMIALTLYSQEYCIAASAFNVLYRGIENPVEIVVENCSCDSIDIVATNARIRKTRPCKYVVIPGSHRDMSFTVKRLKNGDTIHVGTMDFRVLDTPDPTPDIGGISGGELQKLQLISQRGIRAKLDDFILDTEFNVVSYSVVIERNQSTVYRNDFVGERFPTELQEELRELMPGDHLRFENIEAMGPGESIRNLASMNFTIR